MFSNDDKGLVTRINLISREIRCEIKGQAPGWS